MRRRRQVLAVVSLLLIFAILIASVPLASAFSSAPSPTSSSSLLKRLVVAPERPAGYRRDLFPHWDLVASSCSVRETVLRQESTTRASVDPRTCSVRSGRWVSVYDATVLTDPSKIDIDHVVALKEAWDSGAWSWSPDRRRAFANDLSDPRSLIAVSATSNRRKSDQDPSTWLPAAGHRCTYLTDWIGVKLRWGLSVDTSELDALQRLERTCGATSPADGQTSPSSTNSSSPTAPATTVSADAETGSTGVYYSSCAQARAAGAAPLRRGDPGYRSGLDRDNDGVACE